MTDPAPHPLALAHQPSIVKQTKWKCVVMDLEPENGVCYFNPTVIDLGGEVHLIVRKNINRGKPSEYNRLVRFTLNPITLEPVSNEIEIELPKVHPEEHFEDPRAIVQGDKVWLSCSTFVLRASYTHQAFFLMDTSWNCLRRFDPAYGRNFEQPWTNDGHEKNWLWFRHDGLPHAVYATDPHVVVKFNGSLIPQEVHATKRQIPWKLHEPRGGTPPVLVDGLYWSFFHSSLAAKPIKRRYFMGAYAFSPTPPFEVVKMTGNAMLAASGEDRTDPRVPLVVFPGGLLFNHSTRVWTIFLGVNDIDCAWIKIPHADVEKLVTELKDSPVPVKFRPEGENVISL